MTNLRNQLEEIMKTQKYNYIGIRGTDEKLELGEILGTSYEWDYENDCSSIETNPIELGGVCCIDLTNLSIDKVIERIEYAERNYYYSHYSIVISNTRNPLGYDENDDYEVILAGAKVVAIVA